MAQGFTGRLAAILARKNSGSDVGPRRRLNFIEGTNVTLTVADDATNNEIDITITATDPSPLTTKGDLYGYDTGGARIPVGSDDQVLVADSSDAQGIVWGAVPTHATRHSDGGADEITVSNLGSGAATDGDLLASDGAGGLEWLTPADNELASASLSSSSANIELDLPASASNYTDLLILARLRSDYTSQTQDKVELNFGGTSIDTTSSYRYGWRRGYNGGASNNAAISAAFIELGWCSAGAGSTAGFFGSTRIVVHRFGSSIQRNVEFGGGNIQTGSDWNVIMGTGVWQNTSDAIDKIRLTPVNGSNFVSGSSVKVYGLPASGTGTGGSGTSKQTLAFSHAGNLETGTGVFRIPMDYAGTIVSARAMVNTAPTGSSAIFDINLNGTTIFSTQANRPTIAAAATDSGSDTPNTTSFSAGDYFTVDIDQIGSTVAGANAVVSLIVQPS